MGPEKSIKYTAPAREAIERAQEKYKDELESIIRERKYVPGEDFIEVTASDVERATRQVTVLSDRTRDHRELILRSYMILGVLTIGLGLFYEDIVFMLRNNPTQFMLIVAGITMVAVGFFSRWHFRRRQRSTDRRNDDGP